MKTNLYDELLTPEEGWTVEYVQTQTRNTSGKTLARTEVLWMNDNFVRAKMANEVPIQLTDKEIQENKVNPPRTQCT